MRVILKILKNVLAYPFVLLCCAILAVLFIIIGPFYCMYDMDRQGILKEEKDG